MKFLTLSLFLATSFAYAVNPIGKYSQKHDIFAAFASASVEDCKENGGRWEGDGDEGGCLIEVEDTAEVKEVDGKLQLSVTTIGSNAHTCEFEGPATLKRNVLTSVVQAEQYDFETDTLKPIECIVTAKLTKRGKVMSVENNGKCQEFCGANGWLETEVRKQK